MAMISEKDRQALVRLFAEKLQDDVTITYFTQDGSLLYLPGQKCEYCQETGELLEEVTALHEKLHLEVKDFVGDAQEAEALGIERIPAFVVQGHAKGKVRFFGIPSGYEFSTLMQDLIDVSTGTTGLSEQTRKALAGIAEDVHIQVFVTPT